METNRCHIVSSALLLLLAPATTWAQATTQSASPGAARDWPAVLPEDQLYLRDVAADTWACIAYFVEPTTGLPFDTSLRAEYTSVTNIGYYAACCAVAARMHLTTVEDATERVERVIKAYERFRKRKGFSQSWNHVRTLEPSPNDTMISLLDTGNMVAGLVVADRLLPDVRADVERIIQAMDWTAFYDADQQMLFGGYDMAKGVIDRGWHIGDYAGDGRMAVFWAIAVGAAPPGSWQKLGRETETHFGMDIYRPAWLGGGLFMQTQDGLFLDERSTPAGKSAANFAYAQMLYAERLDLPAWGWSACSAPDGRYLGWGGLEVPVVTPHAAGMTTMIYPHKAADCLRKLEALGAREPFREGEAGHPRHFGFRDSINLRTGQVSPRYLPPLDQAMMFLALANALHDRVVQRAFASDPVVQQGRKLIPEYSEPVDAVWLGELRRRDREALPSVPANQRSGPSRILIDDFEDANHGTNNLGGQNTTWTRDANDPSTSVRITEATSPSGGQALRVDYDVDSPSPSYGGVTIRLRNANASGCDALRMRVRGTPARFKIELHTRGGSGAHYIEQVQPDAWRTITIPFTDFGGMITDWREVREIIIVFEDGVAQPKTGTLWLDDLELVQSPG